MEVMSKEFEFWLTVLFFSLFIFTAVAWLLFARLSMARIERSIEEDGLPVGFQWDGVGGRIVFYALAIVLPLKMAMRIDQLIDVELVRKYATRKDWVLGICFLIAGDTWIFVTIVAMIFDLD